MGFDEGLLGGRGLVMGGVNDGWGQVVLGTGTVVIVVAATVVVREKD